MLPAPRTLRAELEQWSNRRITVMENERSHYVDPNDWDGTAAPDPGWSPAFPLRDHAWLRLKEMYGLPEESRRDFTVFVAILRAFMGDKSNYLPPSDARDQFSTIAKKAEELKELILSARMNETSSELFDADKEFWDMWLPGFLRAPGLLRRYRDEVGFKTAKRGQKWAYYQHFADVAENILNRYGLSLVEASNRKEPRQESIDFLRALFRLATCEIKTTTAASKIEDIANRKNGQMHTDPDS
jgi:hypothetical protein